MTPALSAAIRVCNEAGYAVVKRAASPQMIRAGSRYTDEYHTASDIWTDMLAAGEVKPDE